jgi:hypothetical protein
MVGLTMLHVWQRKNQDLAVRLAAAEKAKVSP